MVDLFDVTVMEPEIVPDKSGGEARASLEKIDTFDFLFKIWIPDSRI